MLVLIHFGWRLKLLKLTGKKIEMDDAEYIILRGIDCSLTGFVKKRLRCTVVFEAFAWNILRKESLDIFHSYGIICRIISIQVLIPLKIT